MSSSEAGSEAFSEAPLWDVQEILAERTSATGGNEVLVVWKPGWIPMLNVKEGDVKKAWMAMRKWASTSMTMQVMLAVEPDSQLEKDIAYITRARAAIAADQKQHAQSAKQRHQAPQGPRKQLGK
jgi:hypothetical protein